MKPVLNHLTLHIANAPGFRFALMADLHDLNGQDALDLLRGEALDFICLPGDILERVDLPLGEILKDDLEQYRRMTRKSRLHLIERLLQHTLFYPFDRLCRRRERHGLSFLRKCAALAPTYYSPGNHEKQLTADDFQAISESGVVYLEAQSIRHRLKDGSPIVIGGLPNLPDEGFLRQFADEKDAPKLLLCHHPEYYPDRLSHTGIELIVSGHAHGGQFRLFGRAIYAPTQGFFPPYTKGLYDNRLIVTTGLCRGLFPRWGNPTEVIIIEVNPCTSS